ncbi:hypothetical protein N0V84_000533 [Fusarium piperis]|uniref:Uncharacterized protein n=1 Tax=Fusarium piperis TaxID=1435070 RepID=A0A9W8WMP2_9HYPO|nr:hypothetical protein N0V84_000533 [Fusarium piperis]
MGFEIDLEPVSSQNKHDSQKRVFSIISTNLRKSGETSTKAPALADDIRKLCAAQKSESDISDFLDALWVNLLEIASCAPPDHPWQSTLVQAVQNLQKTGGPVGQGDKTEDLDWKDLPELDMHMRDRWFVVDPTDLDGWTLEEVTKWKNFNSFAARITTSSFAPSLTFPIWQLRSALEMGLEDDLSDDSDDTGEEQDKGPAIDSRLWNATEWVLFCGEIVFRDMSSKEELDEDLARAFMPGLLCFDINPRSVERVKFWRKRLLQISAQKDALGLSADLAERVSRAAERLTECLGDDPPPLDLSQSGTWWHWLGGTT